ncbi:MAG: N-acetylmuramoyl-L-alanine amidase [Steroidobacteraceae bacterium]|nr:N-acetylmuramoyl-L-alanine amidase [Steroidobacteraceae bacterium]
MKGIRAVVTLVLAGLALVAGSGGALAAARTELRDIDITVVEGGALVSLDTSGTTSHNLFTLEKPDRVVIDLAHTRKARSLRVPKGAGLVETIRTGERPDGAFRVVLELKSAVPARGEWQSAPKGGGKQFVIALGKDVSANASAPAASEPLKVVRPAHAPAEDDRDIIVAVDAGHGGRDPGAIGRNGTYEKDVVLGIARALAARIDAERGMRAVLVRDGDYFIMLRDRMGRARKAKADLFVSVHADSIRDRSITGASVYVLSERGASSEAARWLAERENAADLMGGVSLDDKDASLASVLLDLSQTASLSASMTAAQLVLAELDRSFGVRKSQVQQAQLVVLKSPDIPSMLVETGYISNPQEESRLKNRKYQERLAEAIFTGIRTYFEDNPPAGTRLARERRATLAGVMAAPASP